MPRSPAITPAESEVMEVLWREAPLPAEQIASRLQKSHDWQLPTIKTLINRLLRKKALRASKEGRRYLYMPCVTREQWLATESTSLLDRLFDGRLAPFVAHFSRQRKLSARDIEEIHAILKELKHGR
jgi:BlaI family transcriptional regulator, penicillinase repressor